MTRPSGRTALGREGEAEAARHLTALGFRILARNVRFRMGEIDLVAEEAGCLVFVEVKTRIDDHFGTAAEAVTPHKQRQLVRLAELYLARIGRECACRFDVVAVERKPSGGWQCTHYRNAFSA